MKYLGLCEKYGPVPVALAAMAIPTGIEAGLSEVFNCNADYGIALANGAWSYIGAHFIAKAAADHHLKNKETEIGPTRASRMMQRIQVGVYAGILSTLMVAAELREPEDNLPVVTPPSSAEAHYPLHSEQPQPVRLPN